MSLSAPLVLVPETTIEPEPEKRRQILDGATRVFLATGYEGASMSAIALEASVSKGTLYVYFTNKEALFSAVVKEACHRTTERALDCLDGEGSLEAALVEFARRYVDLMMSDESQTLYRLIVAESPKFPAIGQRFYETGPRRTLDRIKEFLHLRIKAGELVIDDVEIAAGQFIELCKARIYMRKFIKVDKLTSGADMERVAAGAVKVFLGAYQAPRS